MAKGLDVGTLNIICGEKQDNSTAFAQQKNAYLEIDDKDYKGGIFDTANVLFVEKDGQSLLLGEDAVKLAEILKKEVKRPVKHGLITSEDKTSLPLIKLLVEKIIPQAEDGEILCLSSPSSPIDSHIDAGYHNKILKSMAKKLGYNVIQTSEGLAVIYSELGRNGFTGVGISVGAGFTTVTVAHKAKSIVSFSLAKGGDWIDERTAEATGTSKENVKSIKENRFSLHTEYEMGSVEKALSIYYDALTTHIINNLHKELEGVTLPQAEYPVVLAGGSTLTDGFVELFENKLDESRSELPLRISSVKKAKEPIYSAARGCLISALTKEREIKTKARPETETEAETEIGSEVESEEEVEVKSEAEAPVKSERSETPVKAKELPEKMLASSLANKVCVSSDGVVVGTVHNLTVDWNTGSLKDLWIKPKNGALRLNTYSGLYVIPFENVKTTEDYIVLKTLKVE